MADDERELVKRVRAGDQHAFVELATRSKGAVWAACLRITGNPHDAEDALQDALAAAWKNFDRFRGEARFSTWLYRIATNAAIATAKRRGLVTEAVEDVAAPHTEVGDRVADVDRVQAALQRLPVEYREALVLRAYGDMTYEEIAEHLGDEHGPLPMGTVKSRIARAREALEQALADGG